jgi:uncharacterized protein (TIGR00251 family)
VHVEIGAGNPRSHVMLLRVKAIPGARRDEIVGMLGERLKVRVAAPPEGGKANAAICALVARALGVSRRQVEVVRGHGSAEKVLRVTGAPAERLRTLRAGRGE